MPSLFMGYCAQPESSNPYLGFSPLFHPQSPLFFLLVRNPSNPCYFQPFPNWSLTLILKISALPRSDPVVLKLIFLVPSCPTSLPKFTIAAFNWPPNRLSELQHQQIQTPSDLFAIGCTHHATTPISTHHQPQPLVPTQQQSK